MAAERVQDAFTAGRSHRLTAEAQHMFHLPLGGAIGEARAAMLRHCLQWLGSSQRSV